MSENTICFFPYRTSGPTSGPKHHTAPSALAELPQRLSAATLLDHFFQTSNDFAQNKSLTFFSLGEIFCEQILTEDLSFSFDWHSDQRPRALTDVVAKTLVSFPSLVCSKVSAAVSTASALLRDAIPQFRPLP